MNNEQEPEPLEEVQPSVPGKLRVAAIIWIVMGSILVLNYVSQLLMSALAVAHNAGAEPIGGACGALVGLAIPLRFS